MRARSSRRALRLPLGSNDHSVRMMKLFSNHQQPTGARELVEFGGLDTPQNYGHCKPRLRPAPFRLLNGLDFQGPGDFAVLLCSHRKA